jgi:translin
MAGIEGHLHQRELRRDELYERARRLRRLAQGTMVRLHEGRASETDLAEVRREAKELASWVRREARGDEGLARDALQESVEATLLGAVLAGTPLPGPEELGVDPEEYLLGLGDLVGEVRRLVHHRLTAADLPKAEEYVRLMDSVYRILMRFDTTRAIVALKPKQDSARALLERTRGEVTMARLLANAHLPARLSEGTP